MLSGTASSASRSAKGRQDRRYVLAEASMQYDVPPPRASVRLAYLGPSGTSVSGTLHTCAYQSSWQLLLTPVMPPLVSAASPGYKFTSPGVTVCLPRGAMCGCRSPAVIWCKPPLLSTTALQLPLLSPPPIPPPMPMLS